MAEHLIRYMNFEELYSILKKEKIRFKKPYNWPDQYESILQQIFTEQNTYSQFINDVKNNFDTKRAARIILKLYHLYSTQYVCCFTELVNEDNDFMWRSFANGQEIVRVEFDFGLDEITSVMIDETEFCLYQKSIDYSKEINSLKDYAKELDLYIENPFGRQLTYKRPFFINEKEVRLILAVPLDKRMCKLIDSEKIYYDLAELKKT